MVKQRNLYTRLESEAFSKMMHEESARSIRVGDYVCPIYFGKGVGDIPDKITKIGRKYIYTDGEYTHKLAINSIGPWWSFINVEWALKYAERILADRIWREYDRETINVCVDRVVCLRSYVSEEKNV